MSHVNTIKDLCFAARNAMGHFQAMISDLACVPWSGTGPDDFKAAYHDILSYMDDPVLLELFHRALGAVYLLGPSKPAWVRDFIAENTRPETYSGVDFNRLVQGDWARVPVLGAGSGMARVAWFVAGLVPGEAGPVHIPKWAQKAMDTPFIETIKTAERLARRPGPDPGNSRFVLFPMAPANGQIQFKGRSGGLSMGIGFKSLLNKIPVSGDLIATGGLNDSGDVLPVGMLDRKIRAALSSRFKCLLIPAGSRPGHNARGLVPVSCFAESVTVASLYSGRQDNLLFVFSRALQDPASFIDKMDSLPADWIFHEKQAVQDLLGRIFSCPDLFGRFVRKFALMVEEFEVERAAALAEFSPKGLPGAMPMACLVWCTANLSLANHSGKIGQATEWENTGNAFIDPVMGLDINLAADFFNHALVAAHNRYEFSPKVPKALARLLEFMERRQAVQQAFGCMTDLALGRVYGTLVQNFAFCGPDAIRETETLSVKARQALGEPLSPELKNQWIRQYDYLGTARLNAKDMAGADACLETCLDGRGPDSIHALTPWQISMLCRFAARGNLPGLDEWYHPLVSHAFEQFKTQHPWQLVFFNLGRTALIKEDRGTARQLFEKSLGVCLNTGQGPTIEIMALKPLAFVPDLPPEQPFLSGLSQWEKQIKPAASALNPDHFYFLFDRPFPEALRYVRENHDRVFPFSYG